MARVMASGGHWGVRSPESEVRGRPTKPAGRNADAVGEGQEDSTTESTEKKEGRGEPGRWRVAMASGGHERRRESGVGSQESYQTGRERRSVEAVGEWEGRLYHGGHGEHGEERGGEVAR